MKPKQTKTQALWKEAKRLMPGGTQLLSKRPEMFLPERWPAYMKHAKGIEVTDLDGKKYLDFSIMAVGACTLGYADSDVNRAVKKVIDEGSMTTLNSPEEVELARVLLKLNPWAAMVRYARTGGEAVAIGIRIARAYAKKDTVAFCGYHGWHDWYLSTNLAHGKNLEGHLLSGLEPHGVPQQLAGVSLPFRYNHIEELEALVAAHADIGVIVMEPIRHQEPMDGFLKKVRAIADRIGAVLVFDEVSAGFRLRVGGAHALYGVTPDIAVYAKGMSNGYPMAAIVGQREVMQSAETSFISSTYWTERVGPAAALATIKKMREKKVPRHLEKTGKSIEKVWQAAAKKTGLAIATEGPYALVTFAFEYPNKQELKTLFIQEMLRRGFLAAQTVYVSFAHKEAHVKKYAKAIHEVFLLISEAIRTDSVRKRIEGPLAHMGFARLT